MTTTPRPDWERARDRILNDLRAGLADCLFSARAMRECSRVDAEDVEQEAA